MAGQLAVRLVLEVNEVMDAGRWCQLLSRHDVETIEQFAALTSERMIEWGINDYRVLYTALLHAQELMTSSHDVGTIKQHLLVRAYMHALSKKRYRLSRPFILSPQGTSRAGTGGHDLTSLACLFTPLTTSTCMG